MRAEQVLFVAAISVGLTNATLLGAAETSTGYTKWMSGSGDWNDTMRWSAGAPDAFKRVEIHGNAMVRVPTGLYPVGSLQIGLHPADHARVEVDGGRIILLQDALTVGEFTG